MQIDLSPEELSLLTELLRSEYGDLREEIYKTENHGFKAKLEARRKLMQSLLAKLGPSEGR